MLDLTPLRSQTKGPVVGPGDDGWDAARQAWNLAADQRPAAVAFADDADDVAAVVRYARASELRVAVQGTGHGAMGMPPLDGVVLLKTERMRGLSVDPDARRARVEAGVLAGDLGAAAGEHNLAALGGSSPDVGVVGYSLGGGLGWLARRHGLCSSSIRAADVVTADGELVRADADQNTDLFWALRGGGGHFGVVTALELELYPAERVYAGSLFWPAERAAEVLHAYREWAESAPEEFSTGFRFLSLPPIPEVPEPLRGVPVVDVTGAFLGGDDDGAAALEPLRSLGRTIMDTFAAVPPAALSRINGDPEEPVPGLGHHTVLRELTPEAADTLLELAGPGSDSPLLFVATRHLGGALARQEDGVGALAVLDGDHTVNGVGMLMDPAMAPAIDGHLDRVMSALEPWATGGEYLNFADRPGDAGRAFPPEVYARLREIKAAVDPDALFVAAHPIA